MTESRLKRIRLAFEPTRFAAEQLVKVYEELKPVESRPTANASASSPTNDKRTSAKEGRQ